MLSRTCYCRPCFLAHSKTARHQNGPPLFSRQSYSRHRRPFTLFGVRLEFSTTAAFLPSTRLLKIRQQTTAGSYFRSASTRTSSTTTGSIEQETGTTRLAVLLLAAGGTTAYAVNYFHDHFGGSEGLWRAIQFYSVAIPKYLQYRYHQYVDSPQHVWDELDRETSQMGLNIILRLKGFYVKCGQLCAGNIGDAFPPIWQETMSVLQDQVPAEDFETAILPILKDELDYDNIFQSVDPVPIGSASIGQVHRAVLKDGSSVVVKVCYPHVERLLRGDVRTIRAFCEVAQPVHVPGIKEIEKQFPTEFDYRTEAANLEAVRANLEKAGFGGPDKLCLVPRPYQEYCTKHVLVMQALEGEKLVDALKKDAQRWAAVTGKSEAELQKQDGRSASEIASYVAALDSKRRFSNAWTLLQNWTVGIVTRKRREYQGKEELPLNHAQLVDDLIRIHGQEVLVDGVYNADCHPGMGLLVCAAIVRRLLVLIIPILLYHADVIVSRQHSLVP